MTVVSALLELRRYQDGKCKSGRILHEEELWEIVNEMTLELKSEEIILIVANSY